MPQPRRNIAVMQWDVLRSNTRPRDASLFAFFSGSRCWPGSGSCSCIDDASEVLINQSIASHKDEHRFTLPEDSTGVGPESCHRPPLAPVGTHSALHASLPSAIPQPAHRFVKSPAWLFNLALPRVAYRPSPFTHLPITPSLCRLHAHAIDCTSHRVASQTLP